MLRNLITKLQNSSPLFITTVSIILTLVIGVIDAVTGNDISFSILYLVPVMFVTWFADKKSGIIVSVIGVIAWFAGDIITFTGNTPPRIIAHIWNAASRFGIYLIIVYLEAALKKRQADLEYHIQEKTIDLSLEKIEHKKTFESVKRLSLFPELNPNPILEIDNKKNLTYCNNAALAFLEKLDSAADYDVFFPDDIDLVIKALSDIDKNVLYREKKIGNIVLEEYIYVIHSFKVIQIYAIDITDRKIAEENIKKSLSEKEVLLKEIHHRVKNNLQIISSLLRLQSHLIKDNDAQSVFAETQKRINSIASIHKMLYERGELTDIDAADFFRQLTSMLLHIYNVSNKIKFTVESDQITFDSDIVHPLGLLITEILSNSLKYAFPDGTEGEIFIKLKKDLAKDDYVLEIGDTGKGIPKEFETKQSPTLGLQLIDLLSKQLSADYHVENSKGTKYEFKFKKIGEKN